MVAVPERRSLPPEPPKPGPKLETVEPIWMNTPETSGWPWNIRFTCAAVSAMALTEAPGGPWIST